jgi:hypothetical protein
VSEEPNEEITVGDVEPAAEGPVISATELLLSSVQFALELSEEEGHPPERIRINLIAGDLKAQHTVTFGYMTPEFAAQIAGILTNLCIQAQAHREQSGGVILATPTTAELEVKRAQRLRELREGCPPGQSNGGVPHHG